jgi:hypothetical protein
MGLAWPTTVEDYYRSRSVRARIAEYCGGLAESPESFSAYSLAAYGGRERRTQEDGAPKPFPNTAFDDVLAEGADICRALADRGGTLLQLDVDYVSPTDPGAAYRQPDLVFHRLEPVHRVLGEALAAFGVSPLVLATGRGYHFVVRAPSGSPLHTALIEIGRASVPATQDRLAWGHEGAGRLIEHLAHRVLHRLRRTEVPVTLADVPPPRNGPFICLDLSAYGDPVRSRHARCAFSANQKSGMQGAAPERPFVLVVPRKEQPLSDVLRCREDAEEAARWAESSTVAIPDLREAFDLLDDYRGGPVARFHAFFDGGPAVPREEWPFTYDALDPDGFPACVAAPLTCPNPFLLRPACLRTVCLSLWGLGWHPRSVAGLVCSKFEGNHGWKTSFSRYDPALRAAFYVRVLCGALADGLDSPGQFTCANQMERGLCPAARCSEESKRLFASLGSKLEVAGRL